VTDVVVEAARDILADGPDELRLAIADLPHEALNERPAGEGTNALAVIVAHGLASTRSWLSLATAAPLPPRDRPAEFRTVADAGFAAWVDERIDEWRGVLAGDVAFDPAVARSAPWRSVDADEPVTAAWALLFALSHLHEHVGHAHLTRDIVLRGAEQRPAD